MRLSLLSLMLLATISAPALAHEKGAIRLASKQVPAGGELSLRGERLPKNTTLRLELRGALESFPLGELHVDSTGKTQARLALPREARMGNYKVVVLAPDSDIAAQAELVILAAPAADSAAAMDHARMDHGPMNTEPGATDGAHATAEMMPLDTSKSAGEWAAIVAVIVVALGSGVALLTGARHT